MTRAGGERGLVSVDGRRVLVRRYGRGPAVMVIHGSPQSSRAVEAVCQAIAARGLTAIAPDTPGAGRSDPLTIENPDSADYAHALHRLVQTLGLQRVGLYGFHTGAATAATYAALFPGATAAAVLDGLPAWTEAERAECLADYLPPFAPVWDGSHMAWLWARMEAQTVFFPWSSTDPARRMNIPVSDAAHVHANAMDLLATGDAYRPVYRAAFTFQAERVVDRLPTTTLIAGTSGDILTTHFERPVMAGLGRMFADAPALHTAAANHLAAHPGSPAPDRIGEGFIALGDERLACHRLAGGAGRPLVLLHDAGGCSDDLVPPPDRRVIAVDLPGHGDSAEGWTGDIDWIETLRSALAAEGLGDAEIAGIGAGAMLARALSAAGTGPSPRRAFGLPDPVPSLSPEWDGAHLVRAFRIAAWEQWFDPWFRRDPAHALADARDVGVVHRRAVSLLKAHRRWTTLEGWAASRRS
jgi:pimeloyl-ACP methyl ester carboxylesterase